jgi:hypothetical protein
MNLPTSYATHIKASRYPICSMPLFVLILSLSAGTPSSQFRSVTPLVSVSLANALPPTTRLRSRRAAALSSDPTSGLSSLGFAFAQSIWLAIGGCVSGLWILATPKPEVTQGPDCRSASYRQLFQCLIIPLRQRRGGDNDSTHRLCMMAEQTWCVESLKAGYRTNLGHPLPLLWAHDHAVAL